MRPGAVTLLKSGNRLVVDSIEPSVVQLLKHMLRFTSKRILYGAEKKILGTNIDFTTYECYALDHRQRIGTSWGFHQRISEGLSRAGYAPVVEDLSPPQDPSIFLPQWDRLLSRNIELRHGQEDFLVKVFANPCGCFDCPPGFGKSYLIGLIAVLLPKAVIHVVTDRVPVLRDRIYPELCRLLPDVGLCCGGKHQIDHRVNLFSVDSLHRSDGRADILIGDEVHELAADMAASRLSRYDTSRNYGLSATHNMRLDNKNMRVEAIFGPLLYSIPYQEAQAHGMVVPIVVQWRDCIMDTDPCGGEVDSTEKKRWGIWRNEYRNGLIAADARLHDDDQVLIVCDTIEHVLALKKELPEFELVYAEDGISFDSRRYYTKQGIWPEGHQIMTLDRRMKLTKLFERGALKKAIVTGVWNVGVSFNQLQVLIRADAGGSPIMDTQIPGRTSRLSPDKPYGLLYDYLDQFNRGFRQKAANRRHNYEAHGWTQLKPSHEAGSGLLFGA